MVIVELYKTVDGEVKKCKARKDQIDIMKKAGWKAEKPKVVDSDKKEGGANSDPNKKEGGNK